MKNATTTCDITYDATNLLKTTINSVVVCDGHTTTGFRVSDFDLTASTTMQRVATRDIPTV